jgi:hypothetical protein
MQGLEPFQHDQGKPTEFTWLKWPDSGPKAGQEWLYNETILATLNSIGEQLEKYGFYSSPSQDVSKIALMDPGKNLYTTNVMLIQNGFVDLRDWAAWKQNLWQGYTVAVDHYMLERPFTVMDYDHNLPPLRTLLTIMQAPAGRPDVDPGSPRSLFVMANHKFLYSFEVSEHDELMTWKVPGVTITGPDQLPRFEFGGMENRSCNWGQAHFNLKVSFSPVHFLKSPS